jgi:hypothetical protein
LFLQLALLFTRCTLIALLSDCDVVPCGALRLLLETVKHVHSIFEFRYIDHSPCAVGANPNFVGPFANCGHWLEVGRHEPHLNSAKVFADQSPDIGRKGTQVFQTAADEVERLDRTHA